MMTKMKEEIERIKTLFTEERLYGNLVQEQSKVAKAKRHFHCLDDFLGAKDKSYCISFGHTKAKDCGRYKWGVGEEYKSIHNGITLHPYETNDDYPEKEYAFEIKFELIIWKQNNRFELKYTIIDPENGDERYWFAVLGEFECKDNGNGVFKILARNWMPDNEIGKNEKNKRDSLTNSSKWKSVLFTPTGIGSEITTEDKMEWDMKKMREDIEKVMKGYEVPR